VKTLHANYPILEVTCPGTNTYIFRMWIKVGIWPILRRNSIPTVWVAFAYK
jgi:hypothetical protein